jgi:hypothetical protein
MTSPRVNLGISDVQKNLEYTRFFVVYPYFSAKDKTILIYYQTSPMNMASCFFAGRTILKGFSILKGTQA